MDIQSIIDHLDLEIARLESVKSLLTQTSTTTAKKLGRPAKSAIALVAPKTGRRTMSPEGRARIAAAQKARWAKAKKAAKKAA